MTVICFYLLTQLSQPVSLEQIHLHFTGRNEEFSLAWTNNFWFKALLLFCKQILSSARNVC